MSSESLLVHLDASRGRKGQRSGKRKSGIIVSLLSISFVKSAHLQLKQGSGRPKGLSLGLGSI